MRAALVRLSRPICVPVAPVGLPGPMCLWMTPPQLPGPMRPRPRPAPLANSVRLRTDPVLARKSTYRPLGCRSRRPRLGALGLLS